MPEKWIPQIKPPRTVCPERFCFFWAKAGDRVDMSGREYGTLEDALNGATTTVGKNGCFCQLGVCTRHDPENGDHDWYEGHDLALAEAGLPWFYFIPDAEKLTEESREEYIRESRKLWGD